MAESHRHADEANEALDPELLYTKEYCIGQFAGWGALELSWFWSLMLCCSQAVVALARCSRGMFCRDISGCDFAPFSPCLPSRVITILTVLLTSFSAPL
jgi:hypothetical protein